MLFRLQDVTKTYGSITALNHLTVSVPLGAVGLLGPNGSGKTTLIRSLLGLIPVDSGTGEILGMDFSRRQLDIRTAVGFAPEDECLFPRVVGVEFVAYAGQLVGMSRKDGERGRKRAGLQRRYRPEITLQRLAQQSNLALTCRDLTNSSNRHAIVLGDAA